MENRIQTLFKNEEYIMLKEPSDRIEAKDFLLYFVIAPLILCILYVRKIKGLENEKHAAIVVSLSYIIMSMFTGLAITYNLIPVYIYFILSCATPFMLAFTPLKVIDFLPSRKFMSIVKAFLKKKILKRSVVRLRIESAWVGILYTTDITYYKNNKHYCYVLRTNRLDKWEDK